MSMTDPIADFLTRVRNGITAAHETVEIPSSNLKREMARILKEQGYIRDFAIAPPDPDHPGEMIRVRFHRSGGGEALIDTTRPELIPACVALLTHPEDERHRELVGGQVTSPLFDVPLPVLTHPLVDPVQHLRAQAHLAPRPAPLRRPRRDPEGPRRHGDGDRVHVQGRHDRPRGPRGGRRRRGRGAGLVGPPCPASAASPSPSRPA